MGITRFSWRNLAFLAVQLSIIFHKVSGKGIFQLRLLSFTNDLGLDIDGNCCDAPPSRTDRQCSSPCRTYFKICLYNFVHEIRLPTKCTYGNSTTYILGENTFEIPTNESEGLIQMPFEFAWPNDFTLIVDALHTNVSDSKNTTQESVSKLVARLAIQRNQDVQLAWTNDTYTTDDHTLSYSYRVICAESYHGELCTQKCAPRDDFFGHYMCLSDGTKSCLPGWTGSRCTLAVCTSECSHHGRCVGPNECSCDYGYDGDQCQTCIPSEGCLHGTCAEANECICEPGWVGIQCDLDANYCTNNSPCQNGGTCRNEGSSGYQCYCADGFTGVDCEKEGVVLQCLNGGTPVPTSSPPTCICPHGTSGNRCETSELGCVPGRCSNGGTCEDTPGGGYFCLCKEGFAGTNCNTVNHCQSQPCLNGGTCNNLMDKFSCECPLGYMGNACQVDICENHYCYNGGSCMAHSDGARCVCPLGFKGDNCEINVDDCVGNPCENGGTCQDLTNQFRCICAQGYFGETCQNRHCSYNPCENGGTCNMDSVGGFSCYCAEGFTGLGCEISLGGPSPFVSVEGTDGLDIVPTVSYVGHPSTDNDMDDMMQIIKLIAFVVFGVLILLCLSCLIIVIYKKQRSERTSRDIESNRAPPNNRILTYTDNFSNSEKVLPLLSISEKVCNKEQDNYKATHFKDFTNSNSSSNSKNSISKDLKIKDYSSKEFECLQSSGENRAANEDCSVVRYVPQSRHSLTRNCDSEEISNSDDFFYYEEKRVALKRTDSLQTNSQSSSLESTPKHTAKCPILQISAVDEDNFLTPVSLHATEV